MGLYNHATQPTVSLRRHGCPLFKHLQRIMLAPEGMPELLERSLLICATILVVACCVWFISPSNAYAYDISKGTNKADPNTGTTTITVRQVEGDNGWKLIPTWNESPGTKYRWNGNQYTFCINPSCGMGHHTSANESFPARVLEAGDFASPDMYHAMLALLYYSPTGPGYESLGKSFWNITDYQGNAMSEQTIFGMAHVLMGYYYNGCDWKATWYDRYSDYLNGTGDIGTRIPSAFKNWCFDKLIPASPSSTAGAQIGALCNRYGNDSDMLAHGGFTMEEWSKHVYLVMTGGVEHDNYQDFITWDGKEPAKGTLDVSKNSVSASMTSNNSCYSLTGAVYGVYSDEACKNQIATITTNAEGKGTTQIAPGKYYVKEKTASTGFKLDSTVHQVLVGSNMTATVKSSEEPLAASITLAAAKVDADTGKAKAQGTASLEGAIFSVKFYAGYHKANALPESPTHTWTFSTDSKGQAAFSKSALKSGTLFEGPDGKPVIPLGTIAIQETKAPKGYVVGNGNEAKLYVAQIKAVDGKAAVVPLNYEVTVSSSNTPIVPNTVKHLGLRVAKIDELLCAPKPQGDASLEGAIFEVVNTSGNAVVVGGKSYGNGEVCTRFETKESNGSYLASLPKDTLPFGSYTIREAKAPTGYTLNADWEQKISSEASDADGKVFDLTSNPCSNSPILGGIAVNKIDRETNGSHPLAAASLAGATMSIKLSSSQPVLVDGKLYEQGDTILTLQTDENGYAETPGNLLPYATYTVTETAPPTGYLLNDSWSATVEVHSEKELATVAPVDDQVKRGDVRFNKVNAESMERLAGVAFLVTSKTTGEAHVLVADENGSIDTSSSWAAHSLRTNANDKALLKAEATSSDGGNDENGTEESEADSEDERTQDEASDVVNSASTDQVTSEPEGVEPESSSTQVTESASDNESVSSSASESTLESTGDNPDKSSEAEGDAEESDESESSIAEQNNAETADKETSNINADNAKAQSDSPEATSSDSEEPSSSSTTEDSASPTSKTSTGDIDEDALDYESGIWFNGGNDAALPNDSLGALPYDTYTFQELRSSANEGLDLVSFEVKISRDGYDLDMGSVDDGKTYEPPEEPTKPDEPTKPEEPQEPEEPSTPSEPEKPTPSEPSTPEEPEPSDEDKPKKDEPSKNTSKQTESKKTNLAKTGDSNRGIPIAVGCLAAAGLAAAFIALRKEKQNQLGRSGFASPIQLHPHQEINDMGQIRIAGMHLSVPQAAGIAALALILCGCIFLIAKPAFAESGQVTIETKDDVEEHYLVYQVFSADDETADESSQGESAQVKWVSEEMKDAVVTFLSEKDEDGEIPYDEWLKANGHATGDENAVSDTDRLNAQNAAEYLSCHLETSEIGSESAPEPPTRQTILFAFDLAEALSYSDVEPIHASSGETFSGDEGLYLFVTDPDSLDAGEAASTPMWIPIGSTLQSFAEHTKPATLNKWVLGSDGETPAKYADVAAGEDLVFRIETTMPQNISAYHAYHWQIVDTMPSGLELENGDTSSVKVFLDSTDITKKLSGDNGSIAYADGVLTVNAKNILGIEGIEHPKASSKLTVEYHAHVLAGTASGTLTNAVEFKHSAGPSAEGDITDTLGGSACISTYSLIVEMHDKVTGEVLPGAEFAIESSGDGAEEKFVQATGGLTDVPCSFITDDSGRIAISNIAPGSYWITQMNAPEQYEPQESDISLVILPEHDESSGELVKLSASAIGGEQADSPEIATHVESTDVKSGTVLLVSSNAPTNTLFSISALSGKKLFYLMAGIIVVLFALVLVLALKNRKNTQEIASPAPIQQNSSSGTRWQYW